MGNYVACKNYTQKERNHFILLMKSHFSLMAKKCVGIGKGTLHDYLLKTRVEVYPVVYLSDTFLSVCVTWNSIQSGKMETTTLECPIDIHYKGNLLYIAYQLNKILLGLLSLIIRCELYLI